MGRTFAEKILGGRAGRPVQAGETVRLSPDLMVSHDDSTMIMGLLRDGADPDANLRHPARVVIALGRTAPACTPEHAANHQAIRALVAEQGVAHFFDIERGTCHQLLVEEGLALPGRLLLGTDRQSTTCGAVGALATAISRDEAAAVWATGAISLRVPASFRVEVSGELGESVGPIDLALHLLQRLGPGAGRGRALQMGGAAVAAFSVGGRMALCNLAAGLGVQAAYVEPDGVVLRYLARRAREGFEIVLSDADASFEEELAVEAAEIPPLVGRPGGGGGGAVAPASSLAGQPIHQALIGTCVGGRTEDLWAAARRLRGRRVHPRVRLLISPASNKVYAEALRLGLLADLVSAGATILNPSCSGCLRAHLGAIAPGEVCIGTVAGVAGGSPSTRAAGREQRACADSFLASAETVAATAIAGMIVDPRQG